MMHYTKPFSTYLYILCCLLLSSAVATELRAQAATYTGKRLQILHVHPYKEHKKHWCLEYTLVNSGRDRIVLPATPLTEVMIEFDEHWQGSDWSEAEAAFLQALAQQKISLQAGEMVSHRRLKLPKAAPHAGSGFRTRSATAAELHTDLCADLVWDSVQVLKKSKRAVQLNATLRNIGKGPAPCWGSSTTPEDNVSIVAYLSATSHLSKSAVATDGHYLDKELSAKNGVFAEDTTLTLLLKIKMEQRQAAHRFLLLVIDPLQTIQECDKTNNTLVIPLE